MYGASGGQPFTFTPLPGQSQSQSGQMSQSLSQNNNNNNLNNNSINSAAADPNKNIVYSQGSLVISESMSRTPTVQPTAYVKAEPVLSPQQSRAQQP